MERKGEMDKKTVEGRKLAWLSYLGILLLIPLLANEDDNEFSKFHVKQGIVLLVVSIIWRVICVILNRIPFMRPVCLVGMLFLVILMIIGIINALQGKTEPLPVIGEYANKIQF